MSVAFGLRMVFLETRRRFGRFALTVAGVALAIAALVTLEAVMQGVSDAMIRNSVALRAGHVQATWEGGLAVSRELAERVRRAVGAEGVLPRTHAPATLQAGPSRIGVDLFGVAPELERGPTVIAHKLAAGRYLAGAGELVLGQAAADELGLSVGDAVTVDVIGAEARSFRVGGVFRTGVESVDRYAAFADLSDAPAGRLELAVFLPAGRDADVAAAMMRRLLPEGATVTTWRQSLPELVQLISLNYASMNVVLALVLLVLAFGVANTVFNRVSQRTREMGVLRAVGMTGGGVTLLVLAETFVLVGLGGLLGVGVGAAASALWGRWGLDLSRWTSANPHFIASGVVFPRLTGRSLVLPACVAAACALLAGGLPARRAGRIGVIQALRTL